MSQVKIQFNKSAYAILVEVKIKYLIRSKVYMQFVEDGHKNRGVTPIRNFYILEEKSLFSVAK